ncbi:MAG: group II intron reverse transcriptase domain-containing protein [Tyzzerella sp.]|nr:group II intron reverse transcriptase domain-containing protein [Tyzzerella sp.]
MDKDIITDFSNLYRAYRKAKSGKKFNSSTAKFSTMALEGVITLKEQLENQTYQMSPYNEFKIYEPKERVIKSCSFKDKVVQHCFCDNVLLPRLEKIFMKDNYAGQIGKGTLYGMDRLKTHMLKHYEKHGASGWILKCDITKFFYSIDHEILKDIVDCYFTDEYSIWLNHLFIDSTESPGAPLGNQVAQVHALLMLHGMDKFITGELGINHYGRYMDDFFLIHPDKEYLKECLRNIEEFLKTLNLTLNAKTQIVPFRKGIKFLGFHHYVTPEGKYIRKLSGENKRRIKKKLRSWSRAVKEGKMTDKKFYEKYNAWKNHASHGNCIKLCHSMDLYVKELIGGDE